MNHIENTSATNPLIHLAEAMGNPDNFIEKMEERGQSQVVASTTLPVDTGMFHKRPDFEALGFTFGPVVEGDPLFREATLPAGWTKERTEHSMWSVIKDERGIERVSIFYKAAFYDRSAHMNLNDVGAGVAQHWIYGDVEPTELHPLLTKEELESVQRSVDHYRKEAEDYPDICGRHLPRINSLEVAVKARIEAL